MKNEESDGLRAVGFFFLFIVESFGVSCLWLFSLVIGGNL